jgi:hypothetical protein
MTGIDLDSNQLQLVTERSEGWILALQLVGLGMDHEDPQEIAGALSGEHSPIADYLVDEVLDRLRPELPREMKLGDPVVTCNHGEIASKSNVKATWTAGSDINSPPRRHGVAR